LAEKVAGVGHEIQFGRKRLGHSSMSITSDTTATYSEASAGMPPSGPRRSFLETDVTSR
jgi:hypothetical protein